MNILATRNPDTQRAAAARNGLAWLVPLERTGLLDFLLAATAAGQLFYFLRFGPFSLSLNALTSNRAALLTLLVPTLITWGLLTLGALAPLARRPACRTGDLPPGAGLWLAAHALMALAWLILLFNGDPDSLWGFWHLARLDPSEALWIVALLPLALAPGWRRLARAARLARLRRRRATQSISATKPTTFTWATRLALMILLIALVWLLRDRAVMSDGWGMIAFAEGNAPLAPIAYREPAFLLLFRGVHRLMHYMGAHLNGLQTISLINSCAALATLACCALAMRTMRLAAPQRRLGWWILFSSLGITQMLMGRVELYPLTQLCMTATLAGALATMAGRRSPAWMSLAFALGLAGHLSVIFILPAVLIALWLRAAAEPAERTRRLVLGLAHLFGWGALIHLPLWGWLMRHLPDPTPASLLRAVAGSIDTGAEGVTFIGSTAPTFVARLTDLFGLANDFKLIQILFYLAGGAFLSVLMIPLARLTRPACARSAGRPDPVNLAKPAGRAQMAVLGTAFLGYAVYAFTWHADWTWTEDWDLFSGLAPLAALAAIRLLMPGWHVYRVPSTLVRRLCLFALALAATQLYYNHTRATFLNPFAKIGVDRTNDAMIQRYQLEHGWQYGTQFTVENGRVVARRLGTPAIFPQATPAPENPSVVAPSGGGSNRLPDPRTTPPIQATPPQKSIQAEPIQ